MRFDRAWYNARLATLDPASPGLGIVDKGVVGATNGRIVYAGPKAGLPTDWHAVEQIDVGGAWITPGLIDCHTHLVFAGNRAAEFEQRLAGATYADIARAGGGINATVQATRAASEDDLVAQALPRLDRLIGEGVTTIEIKSGYGLNLDSEMRMLGAARRLADERQIDVLTTFLGAHTLPGDANGDADAYIAQVCDRMLPDIVQAGLADAVDAFCETIGFTLAQTERVLAAAQAAGLPIHLHAEQLSDMGGAALAARYRALSVDHLEYASAAGIAAMADAGSVAVLLPGAFYTLRETRLPPVDLIRRHGVPMAVATDCNPGTSPVTSLLMTMNMAATLFGMTIEETIAGVTREAARALGRLDETGTLTPGKRCDLAIWQVEQLADLVYWIGANPLQTRVWHGL